MTICVDDRRGARRASTLFAALPYLAVACSSGGGGSATVPPAAADPVLPIHAVQGAGDSSPLERRDVSVEGVVSGDFQDRDADATNSLGGFFLQAEVPDDNPDTSDGLFVQDGPDRIDVAVGDRVAVDGTVREIGGETRLVARRVRVVGQGAVAPVELRLPAAATTSNDNGESIPDLERYEGMLVRVPQTLTVTGLFDLERFGEVLLAAGGRFVHFTNKNVPDVRAYAREVERHAMRSLRLDDGSLAQNVSPVRYLYPDAARPGYSLRNGDTIAALVGNIRYGRGSENAGTADYRIVPMKVPAFTQANQRPEAPPDPGGSLSVASFNLLNYFTTVDTGPDVCGPAGTSPCRGANSQQELLRQREKIVSALLALDADIVGLIEVENKPRDAIASLTDAVNARAGTRRYAFVDTGSIGSDAIRTAFIYQPASLTLVGPPAVLDSTVDPRFIDTRNRPTLAQTFRHLESGGVLTVAVNHLKSKGSPCDDLGDPDRRDGQANCSRTRAAAAAAMVDWLAADPTASGDDDFLIIGDLNAYLMEDAPAVLESAGYRNLLREHAGPEAYSFVFRGEAGALDHALASPGLAPQVRAALEWHINADEPPLFDYNLEFGRDPALFDGATPWRASDHDPVVVGLDLDPD